MYDFLYYIQKLNSNLDIADFLVNFNVHYSHPIHERAFEGYICPPPSPLVSKIAPYKCKKLPQYTPCSMENKIAPLYPPKKRAIGIGNLRFRKLNS